ncbi:hypothetical protein HZS_1929 [Henneguya salminicola]|nr:hypothetical protein HZS_1929 [Henneguya salminicola]
MERKTKIMYRRVLEKVREIVEIACQTAMWDFEKASVNSIMFCYPSTSLTGCFFHFSQCIWHRIQSGGQSTLYKDNETARCFRLLHLLKKNVIRAYEALEEHIYLNGYEKKFRELLDYYEENFIGRHHRTGRSQPLFTIRLWNQSKRTENGISRTNNNVDGYHNVFERLVGGNHSNIFKFLASLQRKLSFVDVKIDTIHMRTSQQNTRPVYNQINRQLIELMEQRDTIPIITLLEQISYLLTY